MLKNFRGRLTEAAPVFFKDHFSETLLFLLFLCFQLYFRFYEIGFHGLTRDEVASLYFSTHLTKVLTGDSHSIYYYLFLSPITIFHSLRIEPLRIYQGIIGFILYLYIAYRSRKLFTPTQWLFFNGIYGIHPLVFGFARLVRPYGLLIDLATILIIECRLMTSKRRIFFSSFVLTAIYPLTLIQCGLEILFSKMKKDLFKLILVSSLPCVLYYLGKFFVDKGPLNYIQWLYSDYDRFFKDLCSMILGSFYPYSQHLPLDVGPWILGGLVFFMILSNLIFKTEEGKKSLLQFLVSFILVYLGMNLISYYLELRLYRYYVFLFPYFLFALTYSLPPKRIPELVLAFLFGTLILYQMLIMRPYFTPSHSFGNLVKEVQTLSQNEHLPVLACGDPYHNWYFRESGFDVCSDNLSIVKFNEFKGPFLYVYIDEHTRGLDALNSKNILSRMRIDTGKILHMAGRNE